MHTRFDSLKVPFKRALKKAAILPDAPLCLQYGYSLNVATKKCDCLPGYAGTNKCTKCAANTVSYGGKLPTAACFACPAGTVANVNQTECISAYLTGC